MKQSLALLLLSAVLTCTAGATTYYIDYSGGSDSNNGTSVSTPQKRAPGMTGYTGSITPSANDVFYFKRGVTWPSGCFPWVLGTSGTSGNPITWISDESWNSGDPTAKAILDAGGLEPSGGMIQGVTKSWHTFDGLYIKNHSVTSTEDGTKAIDLSSCSGITVQNCRLQTFAWISIYIHFDDPGTYSAIHILNNECSDTTALLWCADAYETGRNRSDIKVSGNWIHDFSSKIGGGGGGGDGTHGDGLIHSYGSSAVSGIEISNNLCTGNYTRSFGTGGGMTAWIFFEDDAGDSGIIYNNIIAPSSVPSYKLTECFIRLSGGTTGSHNWKVYNNHLVNTNPANPTMASAGIFSTGQGTHDFKNNVITAIQYAMWINVPTGEYSIDYNINASTSGQLVSSGTGEPTFQTFFGNQS